MKTIYKQGFATSIGISFVFSLILLYLNNLILPVSPVRPQGFNFRVLRFMLSHEGWIPFTIIFIFFAGLIYLLQVYLLDYPIIANAHRLNEDQDIIEAVKSGSINDLEVALKKQIDAGQLGYYGSRFKLLFESFGGNQDISAVIDLKRNLVEMDEEKVVRSLVPITWCEATLPILGFLGTVVGIGQALGGLGGVVQNLITSGGAPGAVDQNFSEGFASMALAFDTTFLGLAGLIILGIFHLSLKKAFATRLAEIDKLFTETISRWTIGGTSSVLSALKSVSDRLDTVENVLVSTRNMAERLILNNPALESMKRILFSPITNFEEFGASLGEESRDHINQLVGNSNWQFKALSLPLAGSNIAAAIVRESAKQDKLYIFEIDGNRRGELHQSKYQFKKVWISDDPKIMMAETTEGKLISITIKPDYEEQPITKIGADQQLQEQNHVFQVTLDERNLFLIILRKEKTLEIHVTDALADKAQKVSSLWDGFDWSVWSVHAPSATLLVAGKSLTGNRWRLMHISLHSNPMSDMMFTENKHIDLPVDVVPKQMIAIGGDEILILDSGGGLHYWNKKLKTPFLLTHRLWVRDPQASIQPGANGWIAVATNNHLSMWRIKGGGVFYPFENRKKFDVNGIDVKSLMATADGRYLAATRGRRILMWKYPIDTID